MLIEAYFHTTQELDQFVNYLQKFGRTRTQIVFSTCVEHRGIPLSEDSTLQPPNSLKKSEKNDSDTEKKDPDSITALDGNKATAGDSVQFKVTGDVAKVEGLDGLKYSFTNGYITVNTEPDVATVLSVTVIGTDGSTATSVVTVNVLNN